MIPAGGYSLNVADTTNQTARSELDQKAGGSGNRGFSFGHVGGIGNAGGVGSGTLSDFLPWILAGVVGVAIVAWFILRKK